MCKIDIFWEAFAYIDNLSHSKSVCQHHSDDPNLMPIPQKKYQVIKPSEDETKKTTPFIIVSKRIIRTTFNKRNATLRL